LKDEESTTMYKDMAYIMEKYSASRDTVCRWIKYHGMPALKLPGNKGRWRFDPEAVQKWIEANVNKKG
jgi:excisionase family DNA binding protein